MHKSLHALMCILMLTAVLYRCNNNPEGPVLVTPDKPDIETFITKTAVICALSHVSSEDFDGFNLYWSTSPGVSKQSNKIEVLNSSYCIHTGLTPNTTYYYRTAMINEGVESSLGEEDSATTDTIPVPILSLMQREFSVTDSSTSITFYVDPSYLNYPNYRDTINFYLYRSTISGTGKNGTKILYDSDANKDLDSLTTYYYVGTAFVDTFESDISEEISVKTSIRIGDIAFPDTALANAFANDSQKSTCQFAHELVLDSLGIINLSGLHLFEDVQRLYLRGNSITHIDQIQFMSSLSVIDLRNNTIQDILWLAALDSLDTLLLNDNEIQSGVQALADSTALGFVDFTGNTGIPCAELSAIVSVADSTVPSQTEPGSNCAE